MESATTGSILHESTNTKQSLFSKANTWLNVCACIFPSRLLNCRRLRWEKTKPIIRVDPLDPRHNKTENLVNQDSLFEYVIQFAINIKIVNSLTV